MAHKTSISLITLCYLAAVLVGAWFVVTQLSWLEILGLGGVWRFPAGDLAQNLAGHLAYQSAPWDWPLLRADNLDSPTGLSVAMTDSNPLVSLLGKFFIHATGQAPRNLLGLWVALCLFLQPVAAVYATRGLPVARVETAIAGALFAISFPAFLARYGHVNLLGHFYILLALGFALRDARRLEAPAFAARFGLLLGAVLSHPYLFFFAALLLSTGFWSELFRGAAWRGTLAAYLVLIVAVLLVDYGLSGTFGQGAIGFGYYSMNLLSPVWPHGSWFFPGLTELDATGGQYEGYNYLGAGALLAIALALPQLRHLIWRDWYGLIFVLACLTLLALSSKVYAGHSLLISLGLQPWRQIFGWVQSSGRAFWAVGYFVTLAALAGLERLPRGPTLALLTGLTGLQMLDVSPLRAQEALDFSGSLAQARPLMQIPPDTTLFTMVPACDRDPDGAGGALLLEAVRQGVALSHLRAARDPSWFNCDRSLSDGTELPIGPGELRAFRPNELLQPLRASLFQAGARCSQAGAFLLCSVGDVSGDVPESKPLHTESLPNHLAGSSIPTGYGWTLDAKGVAWSEGPYATLLFQLAPAALADKKVKLSLDVSGEAMRAGGMRDMLVTAPGVAPFTAYLPDGRRQIVTLTLPTAAIVGLGFVRVTLDFDHPVAPGKRKLTAPVQRAAVALYGMTISALP